MALGAEAGLPGWAWALIILVVLALLALWWYLASRSGATSASAEATVTDERADDLTIIEGIGPRISGVLGAAGIRTFAQLSRTSTDAISKALEEADPRLLRLANLPRGRSRPAWPPPATWRRWQSCKTS